ncbi:PREDICTED: protein LNK3 isoform X2 [Theobroma cacao]|uniref:Protein LNK3 isoform X2 n=1 Tax=Theobroma cacao TaxID=3641 RepID=A0AB32UML3_THECC|nr:PREDICTED: protein LNK3 isoform X2 [Theobroma cacao]
MDWCFGNGIEDLVVPMDQELADRLPSPESWSKWGYYSPGNFESSNKCFVVDENLTCEELKFNGRFCNGTEFETSADAKDPSSFPSVCGGLSEESLNQAPLSYPQPDYELDDFGRFQQMDDIFLSSLLEDLLGSEDLQKSVCFSPEDQCGRVPADYLLTDVSLDSQTISKNEHGMGSAKYLKTHAFSPSMTLEKEIPALRFKPRKSGLKNSPSVKAPLAKILAPPERNSETGFVSEGISLEESVLQELEMVTVQLSNKTRICFRDAFYRLAKNSKQNPVVINQHGNVCVRTHAPMWIVYEEKMRSGRKETTESETNSIDRAIANLTFNNMETNVRDFPIATPAKSKQHAIRVTGQKNNSSNQSGIHYFPRSSVASTDAEVPFLVHKRSQMRMAGHE